MNGILWLASYPKSGNTWLRVFLANLIEGGEKSMSLDEIGTDFMASNRRLFDEHAGIPASDLTHEEIERLRPAVYGELAALAGRPLFAKIHDAYASATDGRPIVPSSATRGAIYLVRHPCAVAVSFAHHAGVEIDTVIQWMSEDDFALDADKDRLPLQLPQKLLSWGRHARSWTEGPDFPVHVIRYEDMASRPMEVFSGLARFAGLPDGEARVSEAVRRSDFRELQRRERETGFAGRSPRARSFFREGNPDGWKEVLARRQVERIVADHGEVMTRFGYGTAAGSGVSGSTVAPAEAGTERQVPAEAGR